MSKDSPTEEEVKEIVATLGPDRLLEVYEKFLEPLPREKPQPRMQKAMREAARAIGLQWDPSVPPDHPYRAELDGALFHNGKRIAVVELEVAERKHALGALIDLLAHPTPKKVLVIGRGRAERTRCAISVKKQIVGGVLPVLRRLMANSPEIEVFTEAELERTPKLLGRFLDLPSR